MNRNSYVVNQSRGNFPVPLGRRIIRILVLSVIPPQGEGLNRNEMGFCGGVGFAVKLLPSVFPFFCFLFLIYFRLNKGRPGGSRTTNLWDY